MTSKAFLGTMMVAVAACGGSGGGAGGAGGAGGHSEVLASPDGAWTTTTLALGADCTGLQADGVKSTMTITGGKGHAVLFAWTHASGSGDAQICDPAVDCNLGCVGTYALDLVIDAQHLVSGTTTAHDSCGCDAAGDLTNHDVFSDLGGPAIVQLPNGAVSFVRQ